MSSLRKLALEKVARAGPSEESREEKELPYPLGEEITREQNIGKIAHFIDWIIYLLASGISFGELPDYSELKIKNRCPNDNNPSTEDVWESAAEIYTQLEKNYSTFTSFEKKILYLKEHEEDYEEEDDLTHYFSDEEIRYGKNEYDVRYFDPTIDQDSLGLFFMDLKFKKFKLYKFLKKFKILKEALKQDENDGFIIDKLFILIHYLFFPNFVLTE